MVEQLFTVGVEQRARRVEQLFTHAPNAECGVGKGCRPEAEGEEKKVLRRHSREGGNPGGIVIGLCLISLDSGSRVARPE